MLGAAKRVSQINPGSLGGDGASITARGAPITVLANEPARAESSLIVHKRWLVPPFTLLKVKRINSFSEGGRRS